MRGGGVALGTDAKHPFPILQRVLNRCRGGFSLHINSLRPGTLVKTPLQYRTLMRPGATESHLSNGGFAVKPLAVHGQQILLRKIDRTCVLANVTRVVDSAGQFGELSRFDYFEIVQTDFGVVGDLPQRNSTLLAERREVRECGC